MLLPILIWHSDRTKLVYFKFFSFAYANTHLMTMSEETVHTVKCEPSRNQWKHSDFLAIWWYMYVLIDWEGGPEGKMFGSSRSWRTERTQRGLCFTTGSQILSRPAGPNSVIIHFIFLFAFSSEFARVTRFFKTLLTPSRTALRRRFLSKVVSKSRFKRMFIRPHLLFKFEYAQLYTYTREYQLISSRYII